MSNKEISIAFAGHSQSSVCQFSSYCQDHTIHMSLQRKARHCGLCASTQERMNKSQLSAVKQRMSRVAQLDVYYDSQ
jgi:hypothetical protein